MNARAISEALGQGVLTWVVTGDGGPLVDSAVDTLIEWGRARCGPPSLNFSVTHLGEAHAGVAACGAARTLPMMSDLRVVVLRDLEAGDDASLGAIVSYLGDPSPSTLLIATGRGLPPIVKGGSNWSPKLAKALGERSRHVKISSKDVSVATFVREHARGLGKELGAREAQLLVEIVGVELGALAREVEKLAVYVGDQPQIDLDAITAASTSLAEAIVWDMTAAIAARNPDLALASLHRLLESGDSSHRLLGLVGWQIRKLVQVAELDAMGRSPAEIAGEVKLQATQVSRLLAAIGKQRPSTALMLERLARVNRDMNDHRAGDRRVFESFVLELSSR